MTLKVGNGVRERFPILSGSSLPPSSLPECLRKAAPGSSGTLPQFAETLSLLRSPSRSTFHDCRCGLLQFTARGCANLFGKARHNAGTWIRQRSRPQAGRRHLRAGKPRVRSPQADPTGRKPEEGRNADAQSGRKRPQRTRQNRGFQTGKFTRVSERCRQRGSTSADRRSHRRLNHPCICVTR